ncbi:hypothetical protein BDP27DRAFT_1455682 [Rhodocollybia butyracea]|uniref:BTB domain-containing protein n=1 Tax=Rhodocollybia butyracea TaxID=206335 RepID=A0A9P5P5K4_9AGAR|nr:hypothetical protein BDP27DRAFT_1455682 [Rhodocollybia butyracea]
MDPFELRYGRRRKHRGSPCYYSPPTSPVPSFDPFAPPRRLDALNTSSTSSDDLSFIHFQMTMPGVPPTRVKAAWLHAKHDTCLATKLASDPSWIPPVQPSPAKSAEINIAALRENQIESAFQFHAPLARRKQTKNMAIDSNSGPGLKRKLETSSTSSQPSPRPKQRPRSKDSPGPNSQATPNFPSPLEYHFYDSFTYLDGNVIIRIGTMQFKLYRMLLAEHGVWFKERFEEDPDDVVQGLPVYILDGVVEEPDFVNLLTAVKDVITYFDTPPNSVVLISILRAAHKLQFARFKNWAIGLLEKTWPAELEPLSQSSRPSRLSARLSPDEATAVVSVACEYGLKSVLKRALYELVRTDCFGQKDMSLASASTGSGVSNAPLSASDYHLLLQARERLVSLWISAAAASFPPCTDAARGPCVARSPVPDTTILRLLHENPSSLLQGFNDAEMEVSRSLIETYTNDPLGGVEKLALLDWECGLEGTGLGYCASCAQARKAFWVKRRVEWWEIFGQVVGC